MQENELNSSEKKEVEKPETKTVETRTVETKTVETKTVETKTVETKTAGIKPEDNKPEETRPEEAKTEEPKTEPVELNEIKEQPAAPVKSTNTTKRIIAVVVIICLLFAGLIACLQVQNKKGSGPAESPAAETAVPAEETADAAEETFTSHAPDFKAMSELYPADYVVMNINGRDITWQEYYYWFYYYTSQISNSMDMMAMYYGQDSSWSDEAGEGVTYSQLPVMYVEDQLKQVETIQGFAKEKGIELTDEDKASYDETLQADIESVCGEGGTQEDFEKALADMYLNMDIYQHMNETSLYYDRAMTDLYGEDGADISDDDAVQYLKDNGYMSAIHILLATTDNTTGESVDEDTKNQIKAKAEELSAELQAIKDDNERLARMKELIAELGEDPGMETYPDGYTFTDGTMVSEFETAVHNLSEYQVSDPVETSYGYHIIMSVPLRADAEITSSQSSGPVKSLVATEKLTDAFNEYYNTIELNYTDGFTAPDITDYLDK